MKYCKSCNQNVQPTKKFSIAWFLINCLWIIGGGVYLLYFIFGKKKICPICYSSDFEHSHNVDNVDFAEIIKSRENGKLKAENRIVKQKIE